jgi:hypothetical protein
MLSASFLHRRRCAAAAAAASLVSVGTALGLALTAPLAFWANLPICPKAEPWVNLATGILQGTVLAWVAVRFSE